MLSENNSSEKDYYTPKETAALLRVSPITVRVWAQKGLLRASTTAGGHRRFECEEITRFARERGIDLSGESGARVLVVDDDQSTVADLVNFFEREGGIRYQVARDAFEAGRKFETLRPSVVLIGAAMRSVSCSRLTRAINGDVLFGAVRVVALGRGAETPEELEQAGVTAVLPKPLEFSALRSLLDSGR